MSVSPDFMAGQQRILDNIAMRNQAMNQEGGQSGEILGNSQS